MEQPSLWVMGVGDVVSRVLSKAEPYQIECLTPVEAIILPQTSGVLIQHIQQFQEFLEILHCRSVETSLLRLLTWLAKSLVIKSNKGKSLSCG
jgi:hypothetical protein